MKKILLFLCLLPCLLEAQTFTYNYGGLSRTYTMYLPAGLPADAPLIFVLHGYGGSATDMIGTGFNALADANQFAVCYPQGLGDFLGTPHWNARLSISTVDDIGFLSSLAQFLQTQYSLSPDCTYSCGMSNGGFMSYTLACERPDVFKAIASITGTMSGYTWNNCTPSTPVPVFQVVGLDDTVVPVDGSLTTFGGWGGAPDAVTVNNFWKNLNMCTTTTTNMLSAVTTATYHTDGVNGNEVWFYQIDNWGHSWPSLADQATTGFDAATEIWTFFSQHCARQKGVSLAAKVFLQGCYDASMSLMKDDLRSNMLIPANEPFSNGLSAAEAALMQNAGMGINPSVTTITGGNAIVDWVLVELRDGTIGNTILASRAALVQRDGDVVDLDGTSVVEFSGITAGSYHVAIKHRNHLGVMTQTARVFN